MLVEVIKPKVKTDKPLVAAYCRVSTDDENQFKSFFAQVEHYENYIKNNPEWEYAGVDAYSSRLFRTGRTKEYC